MLQYCCSVLQQVDHVLSERVVLSTHRIVSVLQCCCSVLQQVDRVLSERTLLEEIALQLRHLMVAYNKESQVCNQQKTKKRVADVSSALY